MVMKKCFTCKKQKEIKDFNSDKAKKDGVSSYCKSCMQARDRAYYLKHKVSRYSQYRSRHLRIAKENAEKILEYLQTHPCVDCGLKDIIVLQFDHLRDKSRNVSKMVNSGNSWERILEEIIKCEVVCANCHMHRTASRANWTKYLLIKKAAALAIALKMPS